MKPVALFVTVAMVAASPLFAANFSTTDRFAFEYALDADGSLWVDNPFGNIEIIGVDGSIVRVSVSKVTSGVDKAAIMEGRVQTVLAFRGDDRVRELRTMIPDPPNRTLRWQSFVSYTIRAPRTAHIKVSSTYADRIHLQDITGDVTVKTFAGEIALDNVRGPVAVETVNGNITYKPAGRPAANTQLATVNGRIEVVVPPDAGFQWVADTIQGDFKTTIPVHPRFSGRTLRALINAATAPILTTSSLMNDVVLLRTGTTAKQARSLRTADRPSPDNNPASMPRFAAPVLTRHFQAPVVDGNFQFATNIGNIAVGEVRGSVRVETGAGQVQLNAVQGECNVISHGGELELGDIHGVLNAHTDAGNITINNARVGGSITTGGGMIRVLSTGGATTLKSDGGDIVVRRAGGPVVADTGSGDVTITMRALAGVDAKTRRGNVVLNLMPRYGADIDATIITSNPDVNVIDSDLNGLTLRRESVGRRTKIRATGKVNGGGQRIVLYAEEGDIHINEQAPVLVSPQQP